MSTLLLLETEVVFEYPDNLGIERPFLAHLIYALIEIKWKSDRMLFDGFLFHVSHRNSF